MPEAQRPVRQRREVGVRASTPRSASAPPAPMRIIEDPSSFVLLAPDALGDAFTAHDRDLFGAARVLADAQQSAVLAVSDAAIESLAAAGADRCVRWPDALSPDTYHPEGRVAFLLALIGAFDPRHILFCDTTDGQDLALRLAAELGERPMTHLSRVRSSEVSRLVCGETLEQWAAPARILTVSPGAAEPVAGERFEARLLTAPPASPAARRMRDLGIRKPDPDTVALEEAPFVVAAGNGLTDWARFAALVKQLNAAPAGSRVVCDAGHLPRDRQVGTSGHIISAECYVALGISGAIQHLQGIEECAYVIAVNNDPYAPIVKRADLAIIADANEVVAAMRERLREIQK